MIRIAIFFIALVNFGLISCFIAQETSPKNIFISPGNSLSELSLIKEKFKISPDLNLKQIEKNNDELGISHVTYVLQKESVRVLNSEIKVHSKNGKIYLISGSDFDYDVKGQENISQAKAWEAAKKNCDVRKLHRDSKINGELVYVKTNNYLQLCYAVNVYSVSPLQKSKVFVSASSGKVVYKENELFEGDVTGSAQTKYSGTQSIVTDSVNATSYRLVETGRGGGISTLDLNESYFVSSAVDFTDTDNIWNNVNAQKDEAATDAHWAAEMFYDYFNITFGRNSFDNAGAPLVTYVHYGINYNNAFWDGAAVNCGNGNGTTTNPYTALDIIAHEYSHGIIETTANLIYSYESGALTESFADMMCTAVEYYAKPGSANFSIGEDLMISGAALRSLSNPNAYGQPDTYLGTNWATGSTDNGGVHTNSGVGNFWFYLLVNGGSGVNDNSNSYNVTGIGMTDAMRIVYRTLTVYLTTNSQYSDARTLSIQAAVDLFGACSAEADAVQMAWFAVGIGTAPSNNPVVASFTPNFTFSCTLPSSVNFTDLSQNATISHKWYFGDGDSSSLLNPTHVYITAGVYTVTLIVEGIGSCGTQIDTLTQINLINISNGGGPIPINCSPITTGAGTLGMGISIFSLGSINNSTNGGTDGYQDYTCQYSTNLTEGLSSAISVTTGTVYNEDVAVWIDLNNDGVFNATTEKVFESLNQMTNHSGTILVPAGTVLNTPLRLRVSSDYYANTLDPCTNSQYGQHEDYTVTILANTSPPITGFVADNVVVNVGQVVNFTDLSQNIPTGWSWTFTGAIPPTSTLENPSVSYSSIGTYSVKLVSSNSFGIDSLTSVGYINVVNQYNMCSGVDSTNAVSGQLFDSGGPTGNYGYNENCSFLINPGCATSVSLSFSAFYSPTSADYMRVYDGVDASGALIGSYNYITAPPNTITANSGSMYITWNSNGSSNYSGWEASWTSVVPSTPPVANFSISNSNPPLNTPVSFTDLSTNYVGGWTWDFGDGSFAYTQNPAHNYTSPGTYPVQLIADNCFSTDTIFYNLTVQSPPSFAIEADTLFASVNCGSIGVDSLLVNNYGTGDLIVTQQGAVAPYDSTSIVSFTASGLNTQHDFYGINPNADTVVLTIGLSGDYDASSEYANLYIEGVYSGQLWPNVYGTYVYYSFSLSGAQLATWLADGVLSIMLDNTSQVNIGVNYNSVQVQSSGVNWNTTSDSTQLIAGGDSTYVYFSYDATNLFAGVYTDSIQLNTNDSSVSTMTVPIYLTVLGQASISISQNAYYFDTLQVGDSSSDTLIIQNQGCDTLFVTGFNTTDTSFSINQGTLTIPPFSEDTVLVSFSPDSIYTYVDTIFIINNDTITYVEVFGVGVGAPIISLNPSVLIDTIFNCGDSLVVPIWVHNIGQGPLNTSISVGGSFNSTSSMFYDGFESGNISSWMNQSGTYTKQVTSNSPAVGNYCLSFSNGNTGHLDGVSHTFTGDTVTSISFYMRNTSTTSFGAFVVIGDNPANYNSGLLYMYQTNSGSYYINGITIGSYSANIWSFIELKNINWVTKTFDIYADGNIISAGISFMNTSITQINTVHLYTWSSGNCSFDEVKIGSTVITSWLASSVDTLNVPLMDSNLVNVTLYSQGLSSGTYNSSIYFDSNDPITPIDSVPVTLVVLGNPSISSNVTCLNYGSTMQNSSVSDSLWIYNTGCDSLIITSISASTSDYTTSYTSLVIAPFDSVQVFVTMMDPNVGVNTDTIWFNSNAGNLAICLTANITGAPVISYNPASFNITLNACADSVTLPLTIYNNGGSTLNYSFTNILGSQYDSTITQYYYSSGQNLTYPFNAIPVVDSVFLEITMNGDYDSGSEYANLYIDGNYMQQIIDGNPSNGTNIVTTYSYGGSNVSTWLADGIITVMLDNSSGVNTGLGGTGLNQVRLWTNGVSWINSSVSSGSVVPGDSSVVNITFNNIGLTGGVYNTNLFITSNDPVSPYDSIPVTLSVSNAPCADFSFNVSTCSGNVSFNDNTINNPTSWQWDFGDGGTSTVQNPSNTYSSVGNYSVQLIVCNSTSCDTINYFVNVAATNGPATVSCVPTSVYTSTIYDIENVTFNTINNSSTGSILGYEDYTCSQSTTLTEGATYTISVTSGSSSQMKDLAVYIDYNNNGSFDFSELAWDTINSYSTHQGNITIPTGAVLGVPLRMRVIEDYYSYTITDACFNPYYGEVEDYTVILQSNTQPPIANFNNTIIDDCQGVVSFTDISVNSPTSWSWDFGDGNTSTFQNPFHTYISAGVYTVILTATNTYGSDTYQLQITINSLNASFTFVGMPSGQASQFNSTSIGAISWSWDFGDGYSATLPSAAHIYADSGCYPVQLTVVNGVGCSSSVTQQVCTTGSVGINEIIIGIVSILPNPSDGEFLIKLEAGKLIDRIEIIDFLGKRVYFKNNINSQNYTFDLSENERGGYFVRIISKDGNGVVKRIILH